MREVVVDLRPFPLTGGESQREREGDFEAEFKVAVRIEAMQEGRALRICVGDDAGSLLRAGGGAGMVRAYPLPDGSAAATILTTNRDEDSMQAALSAARRFAIKYRKPISLSYPPNPVPLSTDLGVFGLLEAALGRQIDIFLASLTT